MYNAVRVHAHKCNQVRRILCFICAKQMCPEDRTMPRQLKGTLEDFHTTQLLHLINLAKKTGTLHLFEPVPTGKEVITGDGMTRRPEVVPGKERAKVSFKEGKLIHAVTAAQDGHLASVLHKSGKLN